MPALNFSVESKTNYTGRNAQEPARQERRGDAEFAFAMISLGLLLLTAAVYYDRIRAFLNL